MRKSPTIKPRVCKLCGEIYTPKGTSQQFCEICKEIKSRETKLRYYHKKFPDAKPKTKRNDVCCVCGATFSSSFDGKPYCNKHYLRMKLHGTPNLVGRKSKNTLSVNGNVATCKTSTGVEFLISSSDIDSVMKYTWCLSKTGYLVANVNGKVTKLHRYLLSPSPKEVIDHINGDTKDNRRENLRICNLQENSRNAKKKSKNSVIVGVQKTKNGRYRARIMVDRKEFFLGLFDTESEAISARKNAEEKYFGDYSPIASRKTSTLGVSE